MSSSRLALGVAHLALGVPTTVLSIVVTLTIFFSKDLFKYLSYKILFQLNLCYCLHIMAHVGVGVTILVGGDCEALVCKLLGGLLHLGWCGILIFNLIIAIERLNVTIRKNYILVSRELFVFYSCIAWTYGAVSFYLDLSSHMTFYFNPEQAQWNFKGEWAQTYVDVGQFITFAVLPITFIIYLVIYAYMAKRRGYIYTVNTSTQQPLIERRFLFGTTLMFLYPLVQKIVYHALRNVNELDHSYASHVATQIMWVLLPLFCQIVQLALNKSIRENMKKCFEKLLRLKKLGKTTSVKSISVTAFGSSTAA